MPKKKNNRLIHEKSPYLLQHAHNPVDWYPWGEEAFAKAKAEDKPIFLSIGYSTCHWCHVMERESFEDEEIAALMKEHFVAIKVDREERPDIDGIYMTAVTALTGSGGWPLSIFLTPDRKPFYGGTYFPPEPRWGSPGFKELLMSIHNTWQSQRERVMLAGDSLTEALQKQTQGIVGSAEMLGPSVLESAAAQLEENHDATFGGFGQAPKFPMAHNLSFLLRYARRKREEKPLDMVEFTLKQMASGGIYDHLGGGFHRYSTDPEWQVPHFEKMLYDQALLAKAYLEGYQYSHNPKFAQVVRETLDYVLRDLQDKEGGFYSAEDADSLDPSTGEASIKREGAFYLWTGQQLADVLDEKEAKIFCHYYGIERDGNVRYDPHGEFAGKNIIFVGCSLDDVAEKLKLPPEKVPAVLQKAKDKLLAVRQQRPRPHLDDKVLADWNGLMISSFALAGGVLDEKKYLQAARKAADFILTKMQKDGRLLHRYRDGEAAILGTIEDYAFFIHGLLDLYMGCFEPVYLREALRLGEEMIRLFWDDRPEAGGGFYFTASDGEELIVRQKEIYDGAVPSGNSLAAMDLIRLAHLTSDAKWRTKVELLFQAFGGGISRYPGAYTQMLSALDFCIGPSREIVIAGPEGAAAKAAVHRVFQTFSPNQVLIRRPADAAQERELVTVVPFIKSQAAVNGALTVYLCEGQSCRPPLTDMDRLEDYLRGDEESNHSSVRNDDESP